MTLDPSGLVVPRLAELRAAVRSELRATDEFGAAASLGAGSRLGSLVDVLMARLADAYELLALVYDSRRPDAGLGVHLDDLCAIVGVIREAATYSAVELTLGGTPETVIPPGSRFRVPGGSVFETLEEAEIEPGGSVSVDARATATGPIEADAGDITLIVDAVSGLASVTNAAAATIGRGLETDSELRARRERSLAVVGAGTDAAIAARLEALADVIGAFVHSNRSAELDAYDVPGHSLWCVVWPDAGVDEAALAAEIWETSPSGIRLHGAEELALLDSQGHEQTIRWSYATRVRVYCTITLEVDSTFPVDGEELVAAAVLGSAALLGVGDDVLPSRLQASISAVVGIRSAVVQLGRSSPPTSLLALSVEAFEIGLLDEADVVIS